MPCTGWKYSRTNPGEVVTNKAVRRSTKRSMARKIFETSPPPVIAGWMSASSSTSGAALPARNLPNKASNALSVLTT